MTKQVADLLCVQKVVYLQDNEIAALKGAVAKMINERNHLMMQMKTHPHVSTQPVGAAKGETTKEAEGSKKAAETVVPPTKTAAEQEQLTQKEREAVEALARSTAGHTKPRTPKTKDKGG